ncbi:amidohydrolase family protein [Chengkuizengella axinellae]|uniref:Amidohydrolase n=1 Tax=Chengkuizengella axinellae TaxID=3064388 RepID=A0ABT9J2E5_9BACL|nr:amidohydrolase [Chengkuizengella sp. 2205SS18-9]MDP5275782.1 amidohydrolase [Chengkuizengella sp. 2205SS18-9]
MSVFIALLTIVLILSACNEELKTEHEQKEQLKEKEDNKLRVITETVYDPDLSLIELIKNIRENRNDSLPLYEIYKDLPVIDVHNHDAQSISVSTWDTYGLDRIVLFGNISEPAAISTDNKSWTQYKNMPDRIIPSFAGVPIYEEEKGLEIVKENLEKGYLNIGELMVASTYSPASNVKWKSEHPYDGNLPEIYQLAAQYKTPILLHIDPPNGTPMFQFEKALTNHPETIFVFAHGNVYTSPIQLESLMKKYDNLYIDFFAGFTAYNSNSGYKLIDFVPLIEKFSERFFVSTDSGSEVGYEAAALSIYELVDLLTPETAAKVTYLNYDRIIELQPPTSYQIKRIEELTTKLGIDGDYKLNKRKANEFIFELEKK